MGPPPARWRLDPGQKRDKLVGGRRGSAGAGGPQDDPTTGPGRLETNLAGAVEGPVIGCPVDGGLRVDALEAAERSGRLALSLSKSATTWLRSGPVRFLTEARLASVSRSSRRNPSRQAWRCPASRVSWGALAYPFASASMANSNSPVGSWALGPGTPL